MNTNVRGLKPNDVTQPNDVTTVYVTMDTYTVAQCAQSLSRYAKQPLCRLLLPPNLFDHTVPPELGASFLLASGAVHSYLISLLDVRPRPLPYQFLLHPLAHCARHLSNLLGGTG